MQKVFWISAKCHCGPKNKNKRADLHDLSETLPALMNQPHGTTNIHMRKKEKRKIKRKPLHGLAIMGETHALKLENEVY